MTEFSMSYNVGRLTYENVYAYVFAYAYVYAYA